MAPRSDSALVDQLLAGSQGAAAELFERYWRDAWRAARAVTGDDAGADDAAQEGFVRAIGALSRFDRRRPFRPWLLRIVVNAALNQRRAGRPRWEQDGPPPVADVPAAAAAVVEAVARLPADRRVVVALRYWLDLSPPEIAAVLDIPVGTVFSRLSRSLAELRSALEVPHDG